MSVYLDGSTLSALLFNHLNSSGCQYGFLTGEKIEQIEGRISDSQIHTYDVSSYIYMSSFIPWPNQETLYSRGGHIKAGWIKSFLTCTDQKLIGWYSFRHNTASRPSLREITLHNSLATSEMCVGQPRDFLFFLCTSSTSADMSTHTYSHGFMHVIDGHFVSIPMTVMNLGDTTRKEYRKRSSTTVSQSKTVLESLHGFQKHFVKPSGEMEQITKMNHLAVSINKSLTSVHTKVFESEAALGLLETDVDLLRQRLELFEQQERKRVQMEAEIKQQVEKKTQCEQVASKEKDSFETLLINFSISPDDNYDNATGSVPGLYQTASFPLESCFVGRNFESFQVIDQTPTLPAEHAEGNSIDINTYCVVNNVSAPTVCKYSNVEQGNVTGTTKMSAHDSRHPQTIKEKVSEVFSFLDDELRLQKDTSPQRQKKVDSTIVKTADMPRVQSDICSKRLVSGTREFGRNEEKTHQFSKHVETTHEISKHTEKPGLLDTVNNRRKKVTDSPVQTT